MKPKPIYTEGLCPRCMGHGCNICGGTGQARDYEAEESAYDQYVDREIDRRRGK